MLVNYDEIRGNLNKRKEELTQIIERIDGRTRERLSEWAGEFTTFDNHIDIGAALFLREQDQVIRYRVRKALEDINTAEIALEKGTYGVCVDCGKPIDDARLNVLPESAKCIDCANKLINDRTYLISQGSLEPNEFWDEMAVWGSSNTIQDGQNEVEDMEDEPH